MATLASRAEQCTFPTAATGRHRNRRPSYRLHRDFHRRHHLLQLAKDGRVARRARAALGADAGHRQERLGCAHVWRLPFGQRVAGRLRHALRVTSTARHPDACGACKRAPARHPSDQQSTGGPYCASPSVTSGARVAKSERTPNNCFLFYNPSPDGRDTCRQPSQRTISYRSSSAICSSRMTAR